MNLKKIIASAAICMAVMVSAQENRLDFLLWEENADAATARAAADNTDFTKDPTLTIYKAANPNGTAIVMCPGGAYGWLATGHEGHAMAEWFNSMGVTYAVLKYRLPQGNHTIPLADAEQAMRIVRSHASEIGVDPHKVGIMGASAGGHLASTLATHYSDKSTRPDFQILFYPVVTMDPEFTHGGSRHNLLGAAPTEELVRMYCNELHVTPETPRAFIMLSSDDNAVPVENTIRYYSALTRNHVPAALHAYPDGGHGWGFGDGFTYKMQWAAELDKWLREEIR